MTPPGDLARRVAEGSLDLDAVGGLLGVTRTRFGLAYLARVRGVPTWRPLPIMRVVSTAPRCLDVERSAVAHRDGMSVRVLLARPALLLVVLPELVPTSYAPEDAALLRVTGATWNEGRAWVSAAGAVHPLESVTLLGVQADPPPSDLPAFALG